jgi:hypothetical protein
MVDLSQQASSTSISQNGPLLPAAEPDDYYMRKGWLSAHTM